MALLWKYQRHKLEVELMREGTDVVVWRYDTDEYGEPRQRGRIVGMFRGLYHEVNESVIGAATLQGFMSATTRYKKIPMVMCLMDELPKEEIQVGDFLDVNGNTYQFQGLTDFLDQGIIADLTLGVLDDGGYV